jgi:hypothetical protein
MPSAHRCQRDRAERARQRELVGRAPDEAHPTEQRERIAGPTPLREPRDGGGPRDDIVAGQPQLTVTALKMGAVADLTDPHGGGLITVKHS